MRNPTIFLLLVILLFILSFFFYTVETFVTDNSHDCAIFVTESGPYESVQIRYDTNRDPRDRIGNQNVSMINFTELVIFDKNKKRIPYWNHQVYFEGGNWPGYPVNNLWDDNMNSFGSSAGPRSNLIVKFNSPQEITSIQLTNRQDCCWDRIQNYNLILYKSGRVVGNTPLIQLGTSRKTVNYILVNESTKGDQGDKGDRGLQGIRGIPGGKGDKGDRGNTGRQGDRGNSGAKGSQGPKGDVGLQGLKGIIGPVGPTGPVGAQGPEGILGPQGLQGIHGTTGDVGKIGLEGVDGATCSR